MSRLLLIIFILLPFTLLGLGYYLVSIPETYLLLGVKQPIWFGVGQSIIASAIVSLIMLVGSWADRSTRNEDESSLSRKLEDYLNRVDVLQGGGIRRLHESRYIRPVYLQHQANVSRQLDLLGMSLKHFQQDLGDEILNWVIVRRDLRIRLLALDPKTPYCNIRDREEGGVEGEISEWSIHLAEKVLELNHPRIQLRWYTTLPTVNIYRLDDVVFIGNYLIGRLSRLTTTLELDARGSFAQQYLKHFEDLWSSPNPQKRWSYAPTRDDVTRAKEYIVRKRNEALQTRRS